MSITPPDPTTPFLLSKLPSIKARISQGSDSSSWLMSSVCVLRYSPTLIPLDALADVFFIPFLVGLIHAHLGISIEPI